MPASGGPLTSRVLVQVLVWSALWLLITSVLGAFAFLQSSRTVVLASHDAVVRPTLSRYVEVHTGPVLPDVRFPTGRPVGVEVYLGKTEAESTEALIERYAVIGSHPEGQRAKVDSALSDMALSAGLRSGALGLVPLGFWLLLGGRRRGELGQRLRSPIIVGVVTLTALGTLLVWQPWVRTDPTLGEEQLWQSLAEFVGREVPMPPEVAGLELRGDVTTLQTRRLVESAIDTYDRSLDFYRTAATDAAGLELRKPEEGDTVVVLVSDRHDNIGMDRVARAIADRAGASGVYDAGDDTSTGQPWEAFSLDSVSEAFAAFDRFAVAGNHDNGPFVASYLDDLGWTMLDGETIDGPGDTTLLGVDDPRSSGLGAWRDETGLSFTEVGDRLADAACDASERVTTILVHDASLGRAALERGCADLVVGGHLHVVREPEQYVGPQGEIGYSFTTGTTGGAAYAIALGSKPRRPAELTLITYSEGRPLGLQGVTLQTDGRFIVGGFEALDYDG